MASEGLSLQWTGHTQALLQVFERLLNSSTLVDCTIAAEGQYLKAHKVILSACSPYFEMLFSQETEKNPIIVLKDIKFQELKYLIDFMYHGEVKIPEDQVRNFVDAAESLQVTGVQDSRKKQPLQKSKNESSVVRRREGRASPVARKRLRSHSSNVEETGNVSAPETVCSNDSNSSDSHPLDAVHMGNSPNCDLASSDLSSFHSNTSLVPSVQSEPSIIESEHSSSHVQSSMLEERLLTNPSVKSEPQPLAQVFVTEEVCLVEPKNEVCVDEHPILENEDEVSETVTGDLPDQHNSNQLSGYPALLDTPERMQDDSFLMPQMAEIAGAQGAGAAVGLRGLQPGVHLSLYQMHVAAFATTAVEGAPAGPSACPSASVEPAPPPLPPQQSPASQAVQQQSQKNPSTQPQFVGSCSECHRVFRGPEQAEAHRRMHAGEKAHRCQCGKAYKEIGHLKIHQRVHAEERPFRCHSCDASFTCKSSLVAHKRTHSTSQYQCSGCFKTFGRSGDLLIHRRLVCLSRIPSKD